MNHYRLTITALGRCLLALMSVCALGSTLFAAPMVYTGLVVTDVRVGTTLFHNASLKIIFEGDTNDIQTVQVPSEACGGTPFSFLPKGVARVEIEFQGHTRTATLQSGQVFVALDPCNGGIGFGSFTGPNGLEPAYPLAFTLGTAEYASILDASLAGSLSVTGAAWSCIGYPPLGDFALPGTASGNCTPPDAYPLQSDIGQVFIYQPYSELETNGSIFSNHSGSTDRGAFLVRPKVADTMLSGSRDSEDGHRGGLVYTLQTVADGWISSHAFTQALVTVRMVSSTKSVTTQPSSVDPTRSLYENRAGYATVTIDDGGQVIRAAFAPGEVYVRYDTGSGVAGFGSQISPNYPIALGCANGAYPSDSSYTADCLQGAAWDYLSINDSNEIFHGGTLAQLNYPVGPSVGVTLLPQSLSQPTLLTGTAHTCAGVYTIAPPPDQFPYFPGDLAVCAGPAPRGLRTSRGDLFLQDLEGGTLSLGNLSPSGAGSGGGWDFANTGYLHVEQFKGDD